MQDREYTYKVIGYNEYRDTVLEKEIEVAEVTDKSTQYMAAYYVREDGKNR